MDIEIYDDGSVPTEPLFSLLAEHAGVGWCWVEGRGFFVLRDGEWRPATDEEVSMIRGEEDGS